MRMRSNCGIIRKQASHLLATRGAKQGGGLGESHPHLKFEEGGLTPPPPPPPNFERTCCSIAYSTVFIHMYPSYFL